MEQGLQEKKDSNTDHIEVDVGDEKLFWSNSFALQNVQVLSVRFTSFRFENENAFSAICSETVCPVFLASEQPSKQTTYEAIYRAVC